MIDAAIPQFAVTDGQYRELLPTMRSVARNEDVGRLARGLALAEGFALHLIGCETPRTAQALILCLASQVSKLRGSPVKMARLSPTRNPDEPLEPLKLGREVFDRLFLADDEPRIVCLDATDSRTDDRAAWIWLFQRLNERRNHLYVIGVPLVLLLPLDLSIELTRFAPDLWSIRSMGIRLLGERLSQQRGEDLPISPPRSEGESDHVTAPPELRRLEREVTQLLREPGPHSRRALVVEFQRLASALNERGETARAIELLNLKILPHVRTSKASLLPELMFGVVETLVRLGRAEEAEQLARQEAIPHLERIANATAITLTLARVADAFRAAKMHEQALHILQEEALPRAKSAGDLETEAMVLSKIAVTMLELDQLEPAQQLLNEHYLLLDQWLSPSVNAMLHLNLAEVQRRQGAPTATIETLQRHVFPLYETGVDEGMEVLAWLMLGQAHKDRGELNEAIAIWKQRVLPRYRSQGRAANHAIVQTMISRALLEQDHREEGRRVLRDTAASRSRWKAETLRDAKDRRDAILQISSLFLAYQEPEEARDWLRSTLSELSPLWEEERVAIELHLAKLEASTEGSEANNAPVHTHAGPEVY